MSWDYKKVFLCWGALAFSLLADVKSINGTLGFDVDNDGQREIQLTQSGLSIGSTDSSANLVIGGNAIITDSLSIGSTSNDNLNIQGSLALTPQVVSSNTTLDTHSIVLADTSSTNLTLDLPYAGNVQGRQITVKRTSLNREVTLYGGGNYIDTSSAILFNSSTTLEHASFLSDGLQWYITSSTTSLLDVASDNLLA